MSDVLIDRPELDGLGVYEFGWHDADAAGASAKRGLSEAVVRDISALKSEGTRELIFALQDFLDAERDRINAERTERQAAEAARLAALEAERAAADAAYEAEALGEDDLPEDEPHDDESR